MTHPPMIGSIFNSPVAQKGKARPIGGQTLFCNICGKLKQETRTKRLVRDHNHKTGIIRGILCDDCNHMLGIFESDKKDYILVAVLKPRKLRKYQRWENIYLGRIVYHLKCNTGIRYSHKVRIPLELLIH